MNTALKVNCRLVDVRKPLEISCRLQNLSEIALKTNRLFSHRRSASNSDNYYDILGVKRGCTTEEVKNAFFTLSKELHPDRNPSDSSLNARFIKLNEAYSVLGRSSTRFDYDRRLDSNLSHNIHGNDFVSHHSPFRKRPDVRKGPSMDSSSSWPDDSFWENRDKSRDGYYEKRSYYGIKGLNRLPNWWIVVGCCVLVVFGACTHFAAIRIGNRISLDAQDRKDRINLDFYLTARMRAKERGNSEQLMWLKEIMDENEDSRSQEEEEEPELESKEEEQARKAKGVII